MKKKTIRGEAGSLVIEATFVYPIMFFVIFFLIYMGNMFFLKSNIESSVNRVALMGASCYGDTMLEQIESGGIPAVGDIDIQPYRYLNVFADGEDCISGEEKLRAEIENTGFFAGMEPKVVSINPRINNYVIYQTYEVDVEYRLQFPIRFLFAEDYYSITSTAHAEVPVVDNAEFIRNTDMVVDYIQRSKTGQKGIAGLTEAIGKLGDFINPPEKEE